MGEQPSADDGVRVELDRSGECPYHAGTDVMIARVDGVGSIIVRIEDSVEITAEAWRGQMVAALEALAETFRGIRR